MTESKINKNTYGGDDAFWEWFNAGIDNGFCTTGACETHEGTPLEQWEEDEFEEGYDPCVVIVRLLGPYAPPIEPPDYSAFRPQSS